MSTLRDWFEQLRGGEGPVATVARGGTGAFAIKVAGAAIAFLSHVAMARLLGVEVYGRYSYVLAWAHLLMLVGLLGLDTAGLRFVSTYHVRGEMAHLTRFLRAGSTTLLLTAAVAGAALYAGVTLFGHDLSPPLRAAFAAAVALVPANALLLFQASALRGLKQVAPALAGLDIVRPAAILLFVVTLVLLGRSPDAAPIILINAAVCAILAVGMALRLRRVPGFGQRGDAAQENLRRWLKVSIPLMLLSGLHMVLTRTDLIMIGTFLGTDNAGVYAAATRAATFVVFVKVAVEGIAAPMIARLHAQGDRVGLLRMMTFATWGILAVAVPVGALLAVAAGPVLSIFGAGFTNGAAALRILALGQIFSSLLGLVGYSLSMTGHERFNAATLFVAALVNIALNLWLIPKYGLAGAALATVSAKAAWNLVMAWYVRRALGINWLWLLQGRYVRDPGLATTGDGDPCA